MKHTIIILLSGLIITGCTKKENTLLEDIEVTTTANHIPELSSYKGMKAWLDENSNIKGFGGNYSFYTEDKFKTAVLKQAQADGKIITNDLNTIVKKSTDYYDDLLLEKSEDFGQTYSEYFFKSRYEQGKSSSGNWFDIGKHYFGESFFMDSNNFYFFSNYNCSYCGHLSGGIKVYRLKNNHLKILSALTDEHFALDMDFIDDKRGWLLANTYGSVTPSSYDDTYIYKTTDGGKSWENPITISDSYDMTDLEPLTDNKLIAYYQSIHGHSFSKPLFISEDAGETWTSVDCNCETIRDLQFIDENIGYVIGTSTSNLGQANTISRLYKTEDGGYTWKKVGESSIYADQIHFKNELVGIAVNRSIVQITYDGGEHWELIHFPYEM